jgi:hypothetical protein
MESLINDTTKILIAELPILFDSVEYLIHPIGLLNLEERGSRGIIKSGSFSSSSYSGSEFDVSNSGEDYISGDMTNLVFENIKTREQRLLTDNVTINYLKEIFKKTNKQYLLYSIIDIDSNHDKELNYNDIESLYISNIDGTTFTKLTKDKHEYVRGEMITSELKYYFKTIEDLNHDGQFDRYDKFHYYYIDFSNTPIKVIEYNPLKMIIK